MNDTIRKIVIPVAAIAAIGYGGAQFAGAQGGSTTPAATQSQAAEAPGTEVADGPGDGSEGSEGSDAVTGAAADQAKAAALAKVPGKVTEISAESSADDAKEQTDVPEKGDTPDPAYESQIAYDVEVTKADGSAVDVALDKSFNVLGTQAAEQHGDQGGDQGESGAQQDD